MYLNSVLGDLKRESAPPKSLHAEHLYKLNEAVFNLPEEDTVDPKMTSKLFKTLEEIRQIYRTGQVPATDANFFYDYLALLGTMQNQHFFSGKQTDKLHSWIMETLKDGQGDDSPNGNKGKSAKSDIPSGTIWHEEIVTKKVKAGKGNSRDAFDEAPPYQARAKGNGKEGKGKDDFYYGEPKGKGKSGKTKGDFYYDEPKGKGKGKGGKGEEDWHGASKGKGKKGKGKSKAKEDDYYYDEPPPMRKGKGGKKGDFYDESIKGKGKGGKDGMKGKGKGKAKGKDYYDEEPKGNGKGKDKGKEKAKVKGKGKSKY